MAETDDDNLTKIKAHRVAASSARSLLVYVAVCTAVLVLVYTLTRPSIEASAIEEKMRTISAVLPAEHYNNDLLKDVLQLQPTRELGQDETSTIYRARKDGKLSALVLEVVAPDGYAGKIRMLMAVSAEQHLLGVRVIEHRETPGLGDYIDPKKDKNKAHPWISQFTGTSLDNLPEAEWRVKKDGGVFDSVTGATVTPRAVIKAVAKALKFVEANEQTLFMDKPTEDKKP